MSTDQFISAEITVQTKIKERKLPIARAKLKSYGDVPDVFEFQQSLLAHIVSFVPKNLCW
jgi:hypothetical protein